MPALTLASEGRRALVDLAPRLAGIPDDAIARPHTDPHAAAVTGVLVGDYLAQAELAARLPALGFDTAAAEELGKVARAILVLVEDLGGDYLTDAKGVPGDLVQRGEAVRGQMLAALEKAFHAEVQVMMWVEAIKLGAGVVDLVYDLRTVAELATTRLPTTSEVLGETLDRARSTADALEFALREGESAEHARMRSAIARLWTLFVPSYEKAATAGRALTRSEGKERQFPPLALVSSHRRAHRRPLSLVPGRVSVMPAIPKPPPLPPNAHKPPDSSPVRVLRSDPPPPLDTAVDQVIAEDVRAHAEHEDRQSWSESRRSHRQVVELEVGISSESNFYIGFTENLSEGGVFVATYTSKPIGSKVEVVLSFPNGEEMRVPGVVRWLREATSEGWPGLGVQFESLTEGDEKNIRKFLSLREPMFYDV